MASQGPSGEAIGTEVSAAGVPSGVFRVTVLADGHKGIYQPQIASSPHRSQFPWSSRMHDVGNALEVREAVDFLAGRRREARLHAVTSALAREMLVLGRLAADHGEADGVVERALASGAAAERFAAWSWPSGGPPISSSARTGTSPRRP